MNKYMIKKAKQQIENMIDQKFSSYRGIINVTDDSFTEDTGELITIDVFVKERSFTIWYKKEKWCLSYDADDWALDVDFEIDNFDDILFRLEMDINEFLRPEQQHPKPKVRFPA